MAEQRDHFVDEVPALLTYIEQGGPVARLSLPGTSDRVRVAFAVDRDRYWALTAELRRVRRR